MQIGTINIRRVISRLTTKKKLIVFSFSSIFLLIFLWLDPSIHRVKIIKLEERMNENLKDFNLTKTHENSMLKDLQLDEEMKRRTEHIQRICDRYRVSSNTEDTYTSYNNFWSQKVEANGRFLISNRFNTSYCIVYKAGTTTWHDIFARLEIERSLYENNIHSLYKVVGQMGAANNAILFDKLRKKNYFNFMVVRHPLNRLLSAYRDRIKDGCTAQSRKFVPMIMRFHKKLSPRLTKEKCMSEFPSFQEFVQFVVSNPTTEDPHWWMHAKACAPCAVKYDAIVKLESSNEEANYIMRKVGMDQYIELQQRHISKVKTESLMEEYFSQITCKQLDGLVTKYRLDFELFQYDYEKYWEYCQRH